jgi:inner membrane protein
VILPAGAQKLRCDEIPIELAIMPSPLGHALAGAAAAWLIQPPARRAGRLDTQRLLRQGAVFAGIAVLPDLDLLWGQHSGATHGLGAAIIVGLVAWVTVQRPGWQGVPGWRIGLAAAAAYASHTLLDWLGSDTSAPIGIMALWPVSREYFESDLHLFMAISRHYRTEGFLRQNVLAVTREIAILVPIVAVVLWIRVRGNRR